MALSRGSGHKLFDHVGGVSPITACVRACVRACERACVRARERACDRACARARGCVFVCALLDNDSADFSNCQRQWREAHDPVTRFLLTQIFRNLLHIIHGQTVSCAVSVAWV